jgi:hypothetical protein
MSYPPGPQDPRDQYGQNPYSHNPYGQNPYGQPQVPYQAPVPTAPTNGRATLSLVLGLISLFFCGLLTGIPAIWLGFSARREIREANASRGGPDGYTGEGGYTPYLAQTPAMGGESLALGGIITGILGTIWSVVVGGLVVALLVFGVRTAHDYNDACDQLRNGQTPDPVLGAPISPDDCP